MNLFYLKKWYFDCISNNGEILYLYLTEFRFALLKFDKFFLYLFNASGKKEFSAPLKIADPASNNIIFNKGSLNNAGNRTTLNITDNNFNLSFSFASAGVSDFRTESIISKNRRGFLTWKLLQPKTIVKGKINMNAVDYNFDGIGYADLVELNIPPWRLPIEELHWGRAHCGIYTVVYDFVKFRTGGEYKKLILISGDENNETVIINDFEINSASDKNETEIKFRDSKLSLIKIKTLTEENIVTEERIKSKFLGNILSSLSGNPYEAKYSGKALLETEGNVFEGNTIFEAVKWSW